MKSKSSQIIIHVLGCLIFLASPLLFAPGPTFSLRTFTNLFNLRELTAHLLMIGFFYLNVFVLIPNLYFKKKYIYFIFSLLAALLIITFLPVTLIPHDEFRPGPPPRNMESSFFFEIGHNFSLFLVVFFISLTLKISDQWKKTQREKLSAELAYLKAQINPHFLFNTLNSIYALSIEKSDKTPAAVVKLSGMMRYVLNEANLPYVMLEIELDYLRSYIELQQVRFDNTIPLTFAVQGDPRGKKIAPLILIPFIENAFKHGINAEENTNITIRINIDGNSLHLDMMNNKVNAQQTDETKSGLGIDTTRKRLDLLYPAKHVLTIQDTNQYFSVALTLDLT